MVIKSRNILFLIFVLFLSINTNAQKNEYVDSLINNIHNLKDDTSKVNILNKISEFYLYYMPPNASEYAVEALLLSEKINYQNGKAESYRNLALASFRKDDYDKVLMYTLKALEIYKKTNNNLGIRNCYYQLSLNYTGLGDFNLAMKYCVKSLKLCQENNDTIGEARTYYRMGTINRYMENYSSALTYLKMSVNALTKYNDVELGMLFYRMGDVYGKIENEQLAVKYYNKSIYYSRKLHNRNSEAYALNGLGNYFFNKSDFSEALEYYNKALVINEQHENYWAMIRNYIGIGNVYIKKGEKKKALGFINKSLEYSIKINDKYGLQATYDLLYQIYESLNDVENAFKYHLLYSDYKDSVFNMRISSNIANMQVSFENEKEKIIRQNEFEKQRAISLEQIKKQKIIIYFSSIAALLLLLLLSLVFYSLKQNKKSNLELSIRNKKIETAHKIIEGKTKEITDSINYAKQIQKALFSDANLLNSILGEHFVVFKPRNIVSGDFYLTVKINNNIVIAVADCTGHGVPGAFMSMLGISFLNEIVKKQEVLIPNKILNLLRNEIIASLHQKEIHVKQKDGMDISLLVINADTNECQWAGANNPLYIVARKQSTVSSLFSANCLLPTEDWGLFELKGNKMPIAIYPEMKDFTNHEFVLQKGECIYLFTDGYADQFGGPKGRKFMYKQFKELLLTNCSKNMNKQKEILEETLNEWICNNEQVDDITIIGIRIN